MEIVLLGTGLYSAIVSVAYFLFVVVLLRYLIVYPKTRLAMPEAAVNDFFEQHDLGKLLHLEHNYSGARHWRLADAVALSSLYFDVREYIYFTATVEKPEGKLIYSCKVYRLFRKVKRVEVRVIPRSDFPGN